MCGALCDLLAAPQGGSAIKQGDPLSPASFVTVCSVLVPCLQRISPEIHVLFYADDLLLFIPLPLAHVFPLLSKVFDAIGIYGYIVGLKINLDKLAFLTNGKWQEHELHKLSLFGVIVRQKVKYLGIVLGHVSSDEAYAPVLARAAMRAAFMRSLPLMFTERNTLFREWVLPHFSSPPMRISPQTQWFRTWQQYIGRRSESVAGD